MAKVKGPLFSVDAAGTIGDAITFKDGHGGVRVERKPVPSYRRSVKQDSQRVLFKGCVGSWDALDGYQKVFCGVEGNKAGLTGYDWFMRACLLGIELNLHPLSDWAWEIAVESQAHTDYGLGYPVTYEFEIPGGLSGLRGWHRHSEADGWHEVPLRTEGELFNGEECVRFDYVGNKVYFSLGFDAGSEKVYVAVSTSEISGVDINFVRVTPYYDNRKCVVTSTADSDLWPMADNLTWIQMCRDRGIWTSLAIVTSLPADADWVTLQNESDNGFLECCSHSRYHLYPPNDAYAYEEVEGSRQDILDRLILPDVYRKGNNQYVPGWVEPNGLCLDSYRTQLGLSKYLADRDTTIDNVFATWDSAKGLYNRIGYTTIIVGLSPPGPSLSELNAAFDAVYAAGGIYHFWDHPVMMPGYWDKLGQHLDHIKEKTDVWYVGWGALYMYHYCEERGKIAVTKVAA